MWQCGWWRRSRGAAALVASRPGQQPRLDGKTAAAVA
jgi:hypothetical protein